MKLTDEQVKTLRDELRQRIKTDSIQYVVDGGDIDHGRVSRLEYLVSGAIIIDHEDVDALLCDGDPADRVRHHVDSQVGALCQHWFSSERGKRWLDNEVEKQIDDEIEDVESRT